jgi:hypothetical protein
MEGVPSQVKGSLVVRRPCPLGASLFTRLMQDLLFGVTPLAPVAFTVAPAVLVVASVGACLGPALRAAAADPAATLRG